MAYSVAWSPEALNDVDDIASYIARDSVFYAAAVVQKILDPSRELKDFPQIGRIVPELSDDAIRERFAYSYRLIYQIHDEEILIVAIVHGKRLLDSLGDRFEEP